MHNLKTFLILIVAAITGFVVSINPAVAANRKLMVVGTAPAGSAAFPYQVGVSTIVNKVDPNLALSTEETGGSVANIRLLGEGKIQLSGFTTDIAVEAIKGRGPFKKKHKLNVLFSMYQQGYIWFGRKDSGIKSWNDIDGKKIAAGTPGGSTRIIGTMIAKMKGLKINDQVVFIPPSSMLDALSDNTIQGGYGIITGIALAPWVTQALATLHLNFFGLDDPSIAKAIKLMPGLAKADYPADFIKGQGAIATISEYLVIGATPALSDEDGYNIVKAVYDNYKKLASYTPTIKGLKLASLVEGIPKDLPFNPGAARFFREKGLLK